MNILYLPKCLLNPTFFGKREESRAILTDWRSAKEQVMMKVG